MRPLVRYRVEQLKRDRVHISIFCVSTLPIPRLLLPSCSAVPWPVVMVRYIPEEEWIVVGKISQNTVNWTHISRFDAMEMDNPAMQHAMAQLLVILTQVSP